MYTIISSVLNTVFGSKSSWGSYMPVILWCTLMAFGSSCQKMVLLCDSTDASNTGVPTRLPCADVLKPCMLFVLCIELFCTTIMKFNIFLNHLTAVFCTCFTGLHWWHFSALFMFLIIVSNIVQLSFQKFLLLPLVTLHANSS